MGQGPRKPRGPSGGAKWAPRGRQTGEKTQGRNAVAGVGHLGRDCRWTVSNAEAKLNILINKNQPPKEKWVIITLSLQRRLVMCASGSCMLNPVMHVHFVSRKTQSQMAFKAILFGSNLQHRSIVGQIKFHKYRQVTKQAIYLYEIGLL